MAMHPTINGSEPLDLQDATLNPAAEPRTPRERAPNPGKTGSEPQQKKTPLKCLTPKNFFLSK